MQLPEPTFQRFALWIRGQAGIHLPPAKRTLVQERLAKRLAARGTGTWESYLRLLQDPAEEPERLIAVDLLTTHETSFYREKSHFEWLSHHLQGWDLQEPFRTWSAAASTGQEVWSLAMVLAEALGPQGNWSILGSDISQRVLQVASDGLYSENHIKGIPTECLRKYCMKGQGRHAGTMRIGDALRAHAAFRIINLAVPLPNLGHFHLIMLRNVLIYFEQADKVAIVERLTTRLQPGGILMTGHSESLHGMLGQLRPIKPGIYQKGHP